jgi:hypothetical protein
MKYKLSIILPVIFLLLLFTFLILRNTYFNHCDSSGILILCFGFIDSLMAILLLPGIYTMGAISIIGQLLSINLNNLLPIGNDGAIVLFCIMTLIYNFIYGFSLDKIFEIIRKKEKGLNKS